ncbi:alpha/beta-hydrolase [Hypoxylon fragiforme]|uniref:alpha/beta-hydrolase n=1 Tax=Hypoxylon fragiforme TaxID=63214 RepID=UPI0020C6F8CE|nr:alpha/beta-hydrolase [Hypoxylon fragiforme]KAI2611565.1 alpha/beta-hydrolase [Hypoxylon fragiforme]
MDQLRPLGRSIDDVLLPTFGAYAQNLIAKEKEIRSTRQETHPYGFAPRHKLDVYYPDANKKPDAAFRAKPVLIFFYGGGFVTGNKVNQDYAHSLVYANLGHYFAAHHGFTVVIPDYRLVSHGAKYPSGGEDLKLAIDWVVQTLTKQAGYESIDLFVLGNSAGGIHTATYLLDPAFKESRAAITAQERSGPGVLLRAIFMLGVPFHWGSEDNAVLRTYLGEEDGKIWAHSSLGVLESEKKKNNGAPPPSLPGTKVSVLVSELDPELMQESGKQFQKEWETANITYDVLDGHNHISPQLGLGTGIEKEEAWGAQVAEVCKASATK